MAEMVLSQIANGLVLGFLYVLLAIGLSIICGLLGIVNFAHGALFALGAYFAIALSTQFGWAAVIVAAVNLARPTLVVFGLGLAIACIGVVLYNVMLSALAIGLLLLSLARRAPEPD